MNKTTINIILFPFVLLIVLFTLPFAIIDRFKDVYKMFWSKYVIRYENARKRFK